MKGRARPTLLKLVSGTYRADRARPNEPVPRGTIGAPPDYLNEAQRAIWNRLVVQAPAGLLTDVDAEAFARYCVLVDTSHRAIAHLNSTNALLVNSPDRRHARTVITNPYLRILRQVCETLRTMDGEFGFTPAARTRISLGPPVEDDPASRFLT